MMYVFHERAFHPDEGFGFGGFGFAGDNRGFSFLDRGRVTSRVGATVDIDSTGAAIADPDPYSDPSHSPWGVYEDYQQPNRAPEGKFLRKSITPHDPEGIQNVTFVLHTWGQNHAFRLSQNTPSPTWVIPDLDITVDFSMRIDLHKKEIRIASTLRGDGFPNSEVFIKDSAGTAVMLNTHHRIGHAAGQLIGNHDHLLGGTEIIIDCNDDGSFGRSVKAIRCVDFMPFDRDLLGIAGRTDFDIAEWNGLHLSRAPTEQWAMGLDTDDNLPIPGFDHEYPRDGRWGFDDIFDEPSPEDLPDWNH